MNTQKNKITLSRRNFLRTSALASGGMLIGFNLLNACNSDVKMPVDVTKLDYKDFNGYISIAENGYVTIFSPNPEIGQGVKTSMPMIVDEELDVEWDKVYVQQAPLDMVKYKNQFAGGSMSLMMNWNILRNTGATAKQMLVNAAAARWQVDPSECTASKGIITNASGNTLTYGEIATEAAVLEVPKKVKLKEPKDFTIIGQSKQNVDLDKIVTGKPLFGLDYKEEGMLYASVIRPPAFGQELASFDATEAKAVNGVVDVFIIGEKLRNLLKKGLDPFSKMFFKTSTSDKVVVVANNTWAAIKAKKLVITTWKTVTPLENTGLHDNELLNILDGKKGKVKKLREDGNVKKAFAKADKVIERTYEAPFLPHNCMEPMNFYANVTDEKIYLAGPSQTPQSGDTLVASMLDRDVKDIQLDLTRMGGGFGRRLYPDFVVEAAQISDKIRKPIKMVSTREDDMTTGVYRPASKYRLAASIKDNKITGYHLKEATVSGEMLGWMPNFFHAAAIENYKVDTASYKSNITIGAWRAPYTNFLASAEQTFFDELAEELKVDRVKLHMDLLDIAKENVKKDPKKAKIQYSPERLQGVLKLAVEKANWGNAPEGIYQGLSLYYCHNTHVAEIADIEMKDGLPVIKRVVAAIDCGIVVNKTGAINQIQGGVLDGIGHAMYGNYSFKGGVPSDKNFDTYRLIRMNETPKVDVHFIENEIAPTGLGEPSLPPAGAAVANAIYKAMGKRLYSQPYIESLNLKGSKILG